MVLIKFLLWVTESIELLLTDMGKEEHIWEQEDWEFTFGNDKLRCLVNIYIVGLHKQLDLLEKNSQLKLGLEIHNCEGIQS